MGWTRIDRGCTLFWDGAVIITGKLTWSALKARFSVSCAKANSMPKKKGGHDAYPLSHELQIQNWNSKTWTLCSKFVPSAPILKRELQFSTLTSNYQPWAPILNPVLHQTYSQIHKNLQIELNCPKRNKSRQCPNTLVIFYYILYVFYYYFILYVFYFYCMLFYII